MMSRKTEAKVGNVYQYDGNGFAPGRQSWVT